MASASRTCPVNDHQGDRAKALPATGFAISLERLISVLPEREPAPLLVLVGSTTEATRNAELLRSSGVSVLHLADDSPPESAFEYATSVDAGWVCYPAPDGLKLAPARPGAEFELVQPEAVSGRVLA